MGIKLQIKKDIVTQLEQALAQARMVVFFDLRTVGVNTQNAIQRALRKERVLWRVAKKTLFSRAFENLFGTSLHLGMLNGPCALIIDTGENIKAAQILAGLKKDLRNIDVFGGFLIQPSDAAVASGKGVAIRMLSSQEIWEIGNLPSKDVLIARFVALLKMPLVRLVQVLQFPIQKLVIDLNQITSRQ